jgi:uncharacterized membrane protein
VLEMKIPHGVELKDLRPLLPTFLSYVLSFVYIGIYWNNHHHMLHTVKRVSGAILWANMHLLFWLSLVPFGTAWMGENEFAPVPVAAYGLILIMAAVAYFFLVRALIAHGDEHAVIAEAVGRDVKGKISPALYLVAIPLALVAPLASFAIYVGVALLWLIPDRRIERRIQS